MLKNGLINIDNDKEGFNQLSTEEIVTRVKATENESDRGHDDGRDEMYISMRISYGSADLLESLIINQESKDISQLDNK